MNREHHYAARLIWTGAAQGPTKSYASYSRAFRVDFAGKTSLEGSADPQFKGDAALHNPEDLLMAALAGCHMLTYLSYAARKGVQVLAYEDNATGTLLFEGGGGQFTEVVLHPVVTVAKGSDLGLAKSLHEPSHKDCFISRSVNFPVRHEATIIEAS